MLWAIAMGISMHTGVQLMVYMVCREDLFGIGLIRWAPHCTPSALDLKSPELGFKVIFPSRSCYLQPTYGLCSMHFGKLLTMGPDAFRGFWKKAKMEWSIGLMEVILEMYHMTWTFASMDLSGQIVLLTLLFKVNFSIPSIWNAYSLQLPDWSRMCDCLFSLSKSLPCFTLLWTKLLNVSCLAEVKHAYQPIGMLMKDDVLEVISYKIRKLRGLSSYASLFFMWQLLQSGLLYISDFCKELN